MTRDYGYLVAEPLNAFVARADALFAPDQRGADLIGLLREAVKPALWSHRDALLSLDPDHARLTVMLPPSGIWRVRRILAALRAPLPRRSLRWQDAGDARDRKLLRKSIRLPTKLLDPAASLDAAAQAAGISIGYRLEDIAPAAGPPPGPPLSWDGPVALGDVLARVVAATALTSYVIESDHAIWLYAGRPPPPTQQDLWQVGEVAALDLRPLSLKRHIGAEMLVHMIKNRVAPGAWRDPAACLIVHPRTARLVVIHYPEIVRRVAAFVYELERTDDAVLWGIDRE